ncbi:MAG: hypothetical protein H7333_11385 [Bdellovibrionales bacterium]|nr:hypothetical protein [Oligoflexia bacterium]
MRNELLLNRRQFGLAVYVLNTCVAILQLAPKLGLVISFFALAACNPSTPNLPVVTTAVATNESQLSGGGGTGDGGGGQGVQCAETTSNPELRGRLIVRDIYEAIYNHHRKMKSDGLGLNGSQQVDEKSIGVLASSLSSYFGPSSINLDFTKPQFWKTFSDEISFVPEDSTLLPSNDANSPLALPRGCKIVQIAFWDESAGPIEHGTLYVDREKWLRLDQFNKIALIAHEYFFKQARTVGEKNSDFIRYKIGQLLTVDGLNPLFQGWVASADPRLKVALPDSMNGFKFCTGSSPDDPDARLQMYQYENANKVQSLVFPVIKSAGINLSLFQSALFTFDPEKEKNLAELTDMLVPLSDFKNDVCNLLCRNLSSPNELWVNLRYSNSGFLGRALKGSRNIQETMNEILRKENSSSSKYIWQALRPTNGAPIKLKLNNPVIVRKYVSKVKSKDALINYVNSQIDQRIKKVNWDIGWDADERMEIVSAISILNKEIENAISDGTYPNGFPSWIRKLKELNSVIPTLRNKGGGAIGFADSRFEEDHILTENYPRILFLIKSNSYSELDIKKVLGEEAFDTTVEGDENEISQMSLLVEQENKSIKFNLSCKDFPTIFRELTSKDEYRKDVHSFNGESIQYTFDRKSFHKSKARKVTAAEYVAIRKFMAFLLRGEGIAKAQLGVGEYCESDSEIPIVNCRAWNEFFVDISRESKIELSSCDGYPWSVDTLDNSEGTYNSCVIMNLKNANQKYLTVFSQKNYEQNRVLYIAKVP